MSKHKKNQLRQWNTPSTIEATQILRHRAEQRCSGLGHELIHWSPAKKKKHGAASQQATCAKCGEVVFISPYLEYTREHPLVPAIAGIALFQPCFQQGHLM